MAQSVVQLSSRLRNIETEYTVAIRKREDGVNKAFRALSDISASDMELVRSIAPSLVIAKTFTAKDIMENQHGEVECIHKAAEELREYVERRLDFYEEQL